MPGLSRTTPLAFFKDGGWYPMATRGERSSRIIEGLMRFSFFHMEYEIPSGPGAAEGELLERASLISPLVSGEAQGFFVRCPLLGGGS